MITIAFDPGINRAGLAVFEDGVLVHAASPNNKMKSKDDMLYRTAMSSWIAWKLVEPWLEFKLGPDESELVAEWPQIYRGKKNKKGAKPNDLLPLSAVAGGLASQMFLLHASKITKYLPKEWADGTEKVETVKGAKKSPRALKVLDRLEGPELEVWKQVKYHDTIDAIGIGLHHLGRFARKRVFYRDGKPIQE